MDNNIPEFPPCSNCAKNALHRDLKSGFIKCKLCGLIHSFYSEVNSNEVIIRVSIIPEKDIKKIYCCQKQTLIKVLNNPEDDEDKENSRVVRNFMGNYSDDQVQISGPKQKQDYQYDQQQIHKGFQKIKKWGQRLNLKDIIVDEILLKFNNIVQYKIKNEQEKRGLETYAAVSIYQVLKGMHPLNIQQQQELLQKISKKIDISFKEMVLVDKNMSKPIIQSNQNGHFIVPMNKKVRTMPKDIVDTIFQQNLLPFNPGKLRHIQAQLLCDIIEHKSLKAGESPKTIAGAALWFILSKKDQIKINQISSISYIQAGRGNSLMKFYLTYLKPKEEEIWNALDQLVNTESPQNQIN